MSIQRRLLSHIPYSLFSIVMEYAVVHSWKELYLCADITADAQYRNIAAREIRKLFTTFSSFEKTNMMMEVLRTEEGRNLFTFLATLVSRSEFENFLNSAAQIPDAILATQLIATWKRLCTEKNSHWHFKIDDLIVCHEFPEPEATREILNRYLLSLPFNEEKLREQNLHPLLLLAVRYHNFPLTVELCNAGAMTTLKNRKYSALKQPLGFAILEPDCSNAFVRLLLRYSASPFSIIFLYNSDYTKTQSTEERFLIIKNYLNEFITGLLYFLHDEKLHPPGRKLLHFVSASSLQQKNQLIESLTQLRENTTHDLDYIMIEIRNMLAQYVKHLIDNDSQRYLNAINTLLKINFTDKEFRAVQNRAFMPSIRLAIEQSLVNNFRDIFLYLLRTYNLKDIEMPIFTSPKKSIEALFSAESKASISTPTLNTESKVEISITPHALESKETVEAKTEAPLSVPSVDQGTLLQQEAQYFRVFIESLKDFFSPAEAKHTLTLFAKEPVEAEIKLIKNIEDSCISMSGLSDPILRKAIDDRRTQVINFLGDYVKRLSQSGERLKQLDVMRLEVFLGVKQDTLKLAPSVKISEVMLDNAIFKNTSKSPPMPG